MSTINPSLPNDGDSGWGDTLNTAIQAIIAQGNAHDTQIQSIGAGSAPPAATTTSQGVVQLAGDLTGTASAPVLKALLTAGSVGSVSAIPVITFDSKGRITAAASAPISTYTDEQARDAIATALVAGPNITITPNDAADTITIASTATGGTTVSDATTTAKGIVQLAGALTGTAAAPQLAATGVGAKTIGGASAVPVLTIGADGRITAASSIAPASGGTAATSDSVSAAGYSITANGLWGTTGSIGAGSKNLTFTTGGLNSTHVGAVVKVAGAGASGVTLQTTISSVTNGTSAVLATAATLAVTNAQTLIGTDNQYQFIAAAAAAAGKRLTFPAGVYYFNNQVEVPANTVIDATGATFLGGGFSIHTAVTIQNGTFIGDGSSSYYFAITGWDNSLDDVNIINNKFIMHSWSIFHAHPNFNRRWNISDNVTNTGYSGAIYLGNMLDSLIDNNRAYNLPAGSRPIQLNDTIQRCAITRNRSEGGITGILMLWSGNNPGATATQGIEVCDNYISGNVVRGQSEEGMSIDGQNVAENATIGSISAGAKTITLSGSNFNSAGAKYAYWWLYVVNGNGIGQLHRITAMSNATLTLGDIDSVDIGKLAVNDTVIILAPAHHNVYTGNRIDGRKSSTYSIWLYSSCHYNVVSNNVTEGAPIGIAGTNAMTAPTGSLNSTTCQSPSSNNVFIGNVVNNSSYVSSYYGQVPGIHMMYFNYGNQTDYYMVGNVLNGNIVRGGQITLMRQEKLLTGNVCDRALVNTSPYTGTTNVSGI